MIVLSSVVVGVYLTTVSWPATTLSPALGNVIGFSAAKTAVVKVARATKAVVKKRIVDFLCVLVVLGVLGYLDSGEEESVRFKSVGWE